MTTREDMESRIRRLMVELWGVGEGQLGNETKLGADLGIDSLDLVELVMAIETEFTVDIPDDVIDGRLCDQSVGDVFEASASYIAPQAQAA